MVDRRDIQTALVVEDDEQLLASYVRGLERVLHVLAIPASCLSTARALAQRHRPELAIVDMNLPDGCGIQLIAELRVVDPNATLLMVSGDNTTASTAEAMRAGATDVVDKPVLLQELIERVTASRPRQLRPESLDRVIWDHIQDVFRACRGNKLRASRQLGIDRKTLVTWLQRPRPFL